MSAEKVFFESDGILVADKYGRKYYLFPVNKGRDNESIEAILKNLKLPPTHHGFKYIVTAVEILKKKQSYYTLPFSKYLYPEIAKKYDVFPATVEHAICSVLNFCEKNEQYREVFGAMNKITPKKFIITLSKVFL